jgi:hypothetical protein
MPAARRRFGLELGAPLPQAIAKGEMMHDLDGRRPGLG